MAVLSIQSHVSYGYVGNRSATFPLQRLGREVWSVNTVEFSNHTGYGSWKGVVLGADHVRGQVAGIAAIGALPRCEAVLSGYLADPDVGEAVVEAARAAKAANAQAVYCCDPVLGDYGRGFFVGRGMPEVMRDRVVPEADLATPNQFELEALTGIEVTGIDSARAAVDALHERGPSVVLVTSYRGAGEDGKARMLVSDGSGFRMVETPELPFDRPPNGAGDLTAAVFLSRWLESRDAAYALEATADAVYAVLERTFRDGSGELRLVEAQDEIAHLRRRFPAFRP